MTEHPLRLVRENSSTVKHEKAKHYLGSMDSAKYAKHLVLFRTKPDAVHALLEAARQHIPGMASDEVVQRVLAHNPDCLWTIARKAKYNPDAPKGEGFIAMLPLTAKGLYRLAMKEFDGSDPALNLIARPGERPAGLYMWGTYAPGPLAGAISLFMKEIAALPYAGVNLYSRPNTPEGVRYNEALGLKKAPVIAGIVASHLYEFVRGGPGKPIYDTYRNGASPDGLSVIVARSFDDLMRVVAIRSAVYMGEQECPYNEEYDGNDMSGTHLLGFVGDEPAGCTRIRFFADFAKIERLAVRKEFRHTRLSFQLVRASMELARMKGYRVLYCHVQKHMVNFNARFGFRVLKDRPEFVFSDFEYVEMVAHVEPHPDAVRLGADPYKIIRPEGRWHVPGILEASATREASRPSIGKH
ncbi:MAG TPA: GNAT family N-acetyltransferase [Rhizomicrobium sp.]|nr:GNAT family N-acetyltransferase [Rhizomicrobium sp.]